MGSVGKTNNKQHNNTKNKNNKPITGQADSPDAGGVCPPPPILADGIHSTPSNFADGVIPTPEVDVADGRNLTPEIIAEGSGPTPQNSASLMPSADGSTALPARVVEDSPSMPSFTPDE